MPRSLRAARPSGESPGGLQRGNQDAGETPALREAPAHRFVCPPRQTSRSAGVPPALLERRALMRSRNIPFQKRLRPVKGRGKRLKFRGKRVIPNAPKLKAAQTFWRVTGGAATRGSRCRRPACSSGTKSTDVQS